MTEMRSILAGFTFYMRDRGWGRVALRSGKAALRFARHQLHLRSTQEELRFYSELLGAVPLSETSLHVDRVIDVGTKDGIALNSLARRFPGAQVEGIELDGNVRYWNGFRRRDVAEAFQNIFQSAGLNTCVHFHDFLTEGYRPPEGAGFTFFYPFVSEDPCLNWGLPADYVCFPAMLRKSYLHHAQFIISTHQGEWEGELAREAYAALGLVPQLLVISQRVAAQWSSMPWDVYLFWWEAAPRTKGEF